MFHITPDSVCLNAACPKPSVSVWLRHRGQRNLSCLASQLEHFGFRPHSRTVGESWQTRPRQPAAKKHETISADLMQEYSTHLKKTRKSPLAVARLQAGRGSRASLRANSQTPGSPPPRRWRRGDSIVVSRRGVSAPPGLVHNSAPS